MASGFLAPGFGRPREDQGFSLVGVLTAGAVLSALSLCLVRAWTVFDGMAFDLLLRQKAVFVLNGEMERLWSVYTRTSFGALDYFRIDYPAVPGLTYATNRYSYPSNSTTSSFVTSSAATFTAQATPDATVFLGTGSPPLNWVWLDRPRGLVARLSWGTCTVSPQNLGTCWGTTHSGSSSVPPCPSYSGLLSSGICELVTVVLEYPYRFNGGSPQALGSTRTTTLSTIVGRRA